MKKLLFALLIIISNYSLAQENIYETDEIILEKIKNEADASIEKARKEKEKTWSEADENTRLNFYHGITDEFLCPIDENNIPTLYAIVNDLANKMDVKIRNIGLLFEDITFFGVHLEKNNALATMNNLMIGIDFIKNLNLNEIKTILAHELAHIKLKHVQKFRKKSLKMSLIPFCTLALTHLLFRKNQSYQNHKYKILAGVMFSSLQLFALAYWNLSRQQEYEADTEAIKYINKDDLKRALTNIHVMTKTPHFNWFSSLFISHPTLNKRLKNIDS